MTNQGNLQTWIRGKTGTQLTFNGDFISFLKGRGYNGTYNNMLYSYLNDILGQPNLPLPDLQQSFASAYGFTNWNSVTSLSNNSNYSFVDGNNFTFLSGDNFVFYS